MNKTRLSKLRRKSYRDSYVKAHLVQGLAFQIKEMRQAKGLTQAQLAKALNLKSQSAIARLEDPSYGKMSIGTLLRLAAFFDVAFYARMVPFSKFLKEVNDVSPSAMLAESFETEDSKGLIENRPNLQLVRKVDVASKLATNVPIWQEHYIFEEKHLGQRTKDIVLEDLSSETVYIKTETRQVVAYATED